MDAWNVEGFTNGFNYINTSCTGDSSFSIWTFSAFVHISVIQVTVKTVIVTTFLTNQTVSITTCCAFVLAFKFTGRTMIIAV